MARNPFQLQPITSCGTVPRGRLLCSGSRSSFILTRPTLPRLRPQLRFRRMGFGTLGAFPLFALSCTSLLVVALAGLFVQSWSSSVPEIIGRVAHFDLSSWVPQLGNHTPSKRFLLADPAAAAQVHYVSNIIRSKYRNADAHELALSIVDASYRAKVDPLLVAAVIKSESSFHRHARSGAGAIGLMQLLPNTGRYISEQHNLGWRGSSMLTDPDYNIKLGIAYLQYLLAKFNGNLEYTLIAYNWGPGNLQQALSARSQIPASPIKYARTIIGNHKKWKLDYGARRAQNVDANFVVG